MGAYAYDANDAAIAGKKAAETADSGAAASQSPEGPISSARSLHLFATSSTPNGHVCWAESCTLDEGEGVDRPSEMMVWEPDGAELLEGTFHLEGGLNWTVRTKDGAMWLLESEAARELESLGPDEGSLVRLTFNGIGEPAYEVELL